MCWCCLMLAHTRSDEKKQKKKKALLALGTRFCALQSQNFEVGNVCIARNYQHSSFLVWMHRPKAPKLASFVCEGCCCWSLQGMAEWGWVMSVVLSDLLERLWFWVEPLLVASSSYVSTILPGSENGGNTRCLTRGLFFGEKKSCQRYIVWWFAKVLSCMVLQSAAIICWLHELLTRRSLAWQEAAVWGPSDLQSKRSHALRICAAKPMMNQWRCEITWSGTKKK